MSDLGNKKDANVLSRIENLEKYKAILLKERKKILDKITVLNHKYTSTELKYAKKAIAHEIDILEYELEKVETYLRNCFFDKDILLKNLQDRKDEIRELEYLIQTNEVPREMHNELLSKKLDLNSFIGESLLRHSLNTRNLGLYNNNVVSQPTIIEIPKLVEVPKVIEVEKLVEVPKVLEVEKLVEVPKVLEVEKLVEVPKVLEVEKLVEVPKVIEVDKYIKVPEIVELERLVEIPKVVEVEKFVEVPKITEVERVITVPEIREVEKIVDRVVEVPTLIGVDRVVEVPTNVPTDLSGLTVNTDAINQSINQLAEQIQSNQAYNQELFNQLSYANNQIYETNQKIDGLGQSLVESVSNIQPTTTIQKEVEPVYIETPVLVQHPSYEEEEQEEYDDSQVYEPEIIEEVIEHPSEEVTQVVEQVTEELQPGEYQQEYNYDQEGYDQYGYDQNYDPNAYDQAGYDQYGYDQAGYDQYSYDQNYDQNYDPNAYDQAAYDQYGYDQNYDPNAYNQYGYDQQGYDQYGYSQEIQQSPTFDEVTNVVVEEYYPAQQPTTQTATTYQEVVLDPQGFEVQTNDPNYVPNVTFNNQPINPVVNTNQQQYGQQQYQDPNGDYYDANNNYNGYFEQ